MYKCIENKFKYYQSHLGSKQCIISLPFIVAKKLYGPPKRVSIQVIKGYVHYEAILAPL